MLTIDLPPYWVSLWDYGDHLVTDFDTPDWTRL